MRRSALLACSVAIWAVALTSTRVPAQEGFAWTLPVGFPAPGVPADNPMSVAKVDLGRHPLLRQAALGERHTVLRELPRTDQRFHGRSRP